MTENPSDESAVAQFGQSGSIAIGRLNWFVRCMFLGIAITPLVMLAVAATLRPAADGLGTHQQLGLPPCSMRVIFGLRCPACGMTTSWSHFVRGQWLASLQSNVGGFALAVAALFFSPPAIVTAARGRLMDVRMQRSLVVVLLGIALVTGVEWTLRLLNG